ncbi:MAG: DUF1080 domain-containing protein [Fimbriimonadales bacterium]
MRRVRVVASLLVLSALPLGSVLFAADKWHPLPFNETDWQRDGAPTCRIEIGTLIFEGDGRGRLMTKRTYRDFELQLEFRVGVGANNGIALRAPIGFESSRYGIEVRILDDYAHQPSGCGASAARFTASTPPARARSIPQAQRARGVPPPASPRAALESRAKPTSRRLHSALQRTRPFGLAKLVLGELLG